MNMLKDFCKRERSVLIVALGALAVTAGLCPLYRLPAEAVLYCACLVRALLACVLLWDFLRYRARLRAVEQLPLCESSALPELPEAQCALEAAYQAKLTELARARAALVNSRGEQERALADTYALWAHQIKTPLSALKLLSQAPADARPGEMEAEITRVEQYVDMALGCARLQPGVRDFVFRRQALAPLVKGAIKRLRRLFILKELTPTLALDEQSVTTDAKWLGFMLEQILTNAIKYTPPGGHVGLRMEARTLYITDDGIGIGAQDLPRVFERGYTGANGREQARATGLGLYLCREAARRMEIALTIDSAPGRGTTVTLNFPESGKVFE